MQRPPWDMFRQSNTPFTSYIATTTASRVPAAQRRPSMMSDFHQPISVDVASSSSGVPMTHRPSMMADRRHMTPTGNSVTPYQPQVENISPTPDDQPTSSSSKPIAEKLEKVERDIKHTENKIKQNEKLLAQLELAGVPIQHVDEEVVDELNDADEIGTEAFVEHIYAENRRNAALAHKCAEKFETKENEAVPSYIEPNAIAAIQEINEKHVTFRPTLISYIRKMDQAHQLRLRYLSDRYDTQRAAWLKRVRKWEMKATTIARREKYIEIFERTFPELRKQREEKQRSDRVEVRTTTSISGTETRQTCSEADELRKLRQQAVIPPMLYDERTQNRFKFVNHNGLVLDPCNEHRQRQEMSKLRWCESEQQIFKSKIQQYGKNFGAIAMFLERKTAKDCVRYYYATKKREPYKSILRRQYRKRAKVYRPPEMPKVSELTQTAVDTKATPVETHTRSPEEHVCVLCRVTIDPASNPGRVLTRACYEAYGLDPEQCHVRPADVRVCQQCRHSNSQTGVKSQTKKYLTCPVGTCATQHALLTNANNGPGSIRRFKTKPTRPIPPRLKQLSEAQRRQLYDQLQIPEDTTKTCTACLKAINAALDEILGDEDKDSKDLPSESIADDSDSEAPFEWTRELDDILRGVSASDANPDWAQLMSRANLTSAPSAKQCARRHAHLHGIGVKRMRHVATVSRIQKDVPVAAGIESEEEEMSEANDSPMSTRPVSPVETTRQSAISSAIEVPEQKPVTGNEGFILNSTEGESVDDAVARHFATALHDNQRARRDSVKSNDSAVTLSADEAETEQPKPPPPSRPLKPKFHALQTCASSATAATAGASTRATAPSLSTLTSATVATTSRSTLDAQVIGMTSARTLPTTTLMRTAVPATVQQAAITCTSGGSLSTGTPIMRGTVMPPITNAVHSPASRPSSTPRMTTGVCTATASLSHTPNTVSSAVHASKEVEAVLADAQRVVAHYKALGYSEPEAYVLYEQELHRRMQLQQQHQHMQQVEQQRQQAQRQQSTAQAAAVLQQMQSQEATRQLQHLSAVLQALNISPEALLTMTASEQAQLLKLVQSVDPNVLQQHHQQFLIQEQQRRELAINNASLNKYHDAHRQRELEAIFTQLVSQEQQRMVQEFLRQPQCPPVSMQQQPSTSGTQLARSIVRGTVRTGSNGTESSVPLLSKGAMKVSATVTAPVSSQSWSRVAPRQTTPSSVPLAPTTSVRTHVEQLIHSRIIGDAAQQPSTSLPALSTSAPQINTSVASPLNRTTPVVTKTLTPAPTASTDYEEVSPPGSPAGAQPTTTSAQSTQQPTVTVYSVFSLPSGSDNSTATPTSPPSNRQTTPKPSPRPTLTRVPPAPSDGGYDEISDSEN